MKLPDPIAHAYFEKRRRDPITAVRALYALEGQLGQAIAAADEEGLMLFSQPLHGPMATRDMNWGELREVPVRVESVFAFLELKTGAETHRLQFTSWQAAGLWRIEELWRNQSGGVPHDRLEAPPPAHEAAPSPLILFCAAVHAILQVDDRVDDTELCFLTRRVPDPDAVQAGETFFRQAGLAQLRVQLALALNAKQRACLMANLIGIAMVDGVIQSAEHELLEQFRSDLRVDPLDYERLFERLLSKNQLSIFAETEGEDRLPETDGITPLIAYCASLAAMMACDEEVLADEESLLDRTVPYPRTVQSGREYLDSHGLDHLLGRLNRVLTEPRKRCLLSNLMALAMIDGYLRGAEQVLLERFRLALEISREEYDEILAVLLTQHDVSLFAG